MDVNTIVTILVGIAGVSGGYMGGKKNSALATDTITMLQANLQEVRLRCDEIPRLHDRIAILEEMVTQRAKVDEVLGIVTEIKEKLDVP